MVTNGGNQSVRDAYTTARKGSLADRAVCSARLKIYRALSQNIDLEGLGSIIDVGVTADKSMALSNFFEKLYPSPEKITAFSDQDASWMEGEYKGLTFVRGTALKMPFEDNAFDLAFSSAVIEHVGSSENQSKFVGECARVAKKYAFITTPNRRYPVEFHTLLPLIHWLPKKTHRKVLTLWKSKEFFAREENLNLLTKGELIRFCEDNGLKKYKILKTRFLGLTSNLLLIIKK